MDRASVLEQLRLEIKQILDNYLLSQRYNSPPRARVDTKSVSPMTYRTLYLQYAILVYDAALHYVDYLIKYESKT